MYDKRLGAEKPAKGVEQTVTKSKFSGFSGIIIDGVSASHTSEVFVKGGSPKGPSVEHGDSSILEDTTNINPYYIGQYEVTQEFYSAVMAGETVTVNGKVFKLEANPSSNRENSLVKGEIQKYRPVESVTWYDAMYFCNVLSRKLGFTEAYTFEIKAVENGHITDANVSRIKTADGYRLPFDYEWEFAARGGDVKAKDFTFAFSGTSAPTYKLDDDFSPYLDNVAWYGFNPSGKTEKTKRKAGTPGFTTHEVGKKSPNRLGIYDMSGNAAEWVYTAGEGDEKCVLGGSYATTARACTVTAWNDELPNTRTNGLGFRLVRSAK